MSPYRHMDASRMFTICECGRDKRATDEVCQRCRIIDSMLVDLADKPLPPRPLLRRRWLEKGAGVSLLAMLLMALSLFGLEVAFVMGV